ncbi:MAG: hypothetical protein CMG55_00745 [Candidatus Marinimicrobia bacterium]|nr:hypothetical protein [Candidatus Neomarinimicrobiota bacterium]|tara:strand:+ start:6120 stop:6998 length:879 start_codon:yes stop_codon:yes gene_type:complete
MKILLSKLPNSGWWQKGIPKYKDNPAMMQGMIPNLELLMQERQNLISIIKKLGHDILECNFPKELDGEDPFHDFVFIRDPFISNQNGTAVILRAGEPSRRIENKLIKQYLETLELKIIEMPNKNKLCADGGEFYFCKKENILFSGLQRNTIEGANFVAEAMNVNKLIIFEGDGFHLDTFFTPAINNKGDIAALIICTEILNNKSKKLLHQFTDEKNLPIFDIPINDAIGTKHKIGKFAANALPLPGILIRPNHFSDSSIDKLLYELGIKTIITSTSQYQLSGGSVHCITNEL